VKAYSTRSHDDLSSNGTGNLSLTFNDVTGASLDSKATDTGAISFEDGMAALGFHWYDMCFVCVCVCVCVLHYILGYDHREGTNDPKEIVLFKSVVIFVVILCTFI